MNIRGLYKRLRRQQNFGRHTLTFLLPVTAFPPRPNVPTIDREWGIGNVELSEFVKRFGKIEQIVSVYDMKGHEDSPDMHQWDGDVVTPIDPSPESLAELPLLQAWSKQVRHVFDTHDHLTRDGYDLYTTLNCYTYPNNCIITFHGNHYEVTYVVKRYYTRLSMHHFRRITKWMKKNNVQFKVKRS